MNDITGVVSGSSLAYNYAGKLHFAKTFLDDRGG